MKRPRWLVPAAHRADVRSTSPAPAWARTRRSRSAHAETPRTAAMRAIGGERFVAVGDRDAGITPLTANVGMRYGLRDGRGYDYPTDKRYDDLWRRAVTKPDPLGFTLPSTQASSERDGAARAGAAGRVAGHERRAPLPLPELYAGRTRGSTRTPTRCRARSSWAPRRSRDDQLRAVTAAGFDPRTTAVVSRAAEPLRAPAAARLTADEPERVVVRADGERSSPARPRRHLVPRLAGEGRRPRRADRPHRPAAARRRDARRRPHGRVHVRAVELADRLDRVAADRGLARGRVAWRRR